MLTKVTCVAFLLFLMQCGTQAQEKTSTECSCIAPNEMESLRADLSESKKEIDTLRTDLQYWQNTTLSILKKYLMDKEGTMNEKGSVCETSAITERLHYLEAKLNQTYESGSLQDVLESLNRLEVQNQAEDVTNEVRVLLEDYKRTISQELREIISSTGQLPLGTFLNPAPSCKHFLPANSSSGDYWIQNAGTGYASLEYCDMTRRCCNSTGGWMRIAYLDMTDPSHHCPFGFRNIDSPVRTCGRQDRGCQSAIFSTRKIPYSRVCGRIKAYQYYSPNGFGPYFNNRVLTIDDSYVDGISLTYGKNPRKHIWTFANAIDEVNFKGAGVCPCITSQFTGIIPPFIDDDYFCDTGSTYRYQNQFYSENPLWDGAGCGSTSTCCEFNNPPWFCKQLPQPTTDNIELRLCGNGVITIEDTPIEQIELYVQ